jgi:putative SOS response-associated peptidase YedK
VDVMQMERSTALTACGLTLLTLTATSCGGGDKKGSSATIQSAPALTQQASFPRPSSRSLRTLIANMPQGPDFAPTVNLLQPGTNRVGFSLYDRGDKQIGALRAGLYVSGGLDETARGPYVARFERITVKPQFRSRQSTDPNVAGSLYVTRVPFSRAGGYTIVAVAQLSNQYVVSPPVQVMVSSRSDVPEVGERAISVHTPTAKSVGGDIGRIDSRTPPDSMHRVDLADALKRHRPVLLLFAAPALRVSRVGALVTDVAEQLNAQYRRKMDFIHVELYNDNDSRKGIRPQVRAWRLTSEPFAFAIDRRGVVAARLEGAFNTRELRAAVKKALR